MLLLKCMFTIAITLVTASCAPGQDHHSENNLPTTPPSHEIVSVSQKCENTPGSIFDKNTQSCFCSESGKFFFVKNHRGVCGKLIHSQSFGEEEPPPQPSTPGWNLESLWGNNNVEPSALSTENGSTLWLGPQFLLDVIGKIPEEIIFSPVGIPNKKEYFKNSSLSVFIGRDDVHENYFSKLSDQSPPKLWLQFEDSFYFTNWDQFKKSFTTEKPSPLTQEDFDKFTGNEKALVALSSYNKFLDGQWTTIKNEGKCLDFCYSELKIEINSNYYGLLEMTKILGANTKVHLKIINSNSKTPVVILQLTPSLHTASLIDISIKDTGSEVSSKLKLFDMDGQLLGKIKFPVINRTKTRRLRDKMFVSDAGDDAVVAVCDRGFLAKQNNYDNRLKDLFLRGTSTKSYLGWVEEAHPKDYKSYYSGIVDIDDNYNQSPLAHFQTVSLVIAHSYKNIPRVNNGIKIAPLQGNLCFDSFERFETELKKAEVRVVNVSLVKVMDRSSCKKSSMYQTIKRTQESQLWIFGAGNVKNLENPKDIFCPNELSNQKNTIVVTDSPYTVGDNYADIMANSHFEGLSGTSFAAPKVSSIAAAIAKKHNALSNEQIRMAILISARIPNIHSPLPVRSGGRLNLERAMFAAEVIEFNYRNHAPGEVAKNLTYDLYGKWSQETRLRLKLYQRNKLFEL